MPRHNSSLDIAIKPKAKKILSMKAKFIYYTPHDIFLANTSDLRFSQRWLACLLLDFCFTYSSTLITGAVFSSESPENFYQSTQPYNPEHGNDPSSFLRGGEYTDNLNDYYFIKKVTVPRSLYPLCKAGEIFPGYQHRQLLNNCRRFKDHLCHFQVWWWSLKHR
jgi:hypothetical protein